MTDLLTNPLFYGTLILTLGGLTGIAAFIISLKVLVDMKALQKSTHSVQYMPIDSVVDKENEDYLKEWATTDHTINEQEKLYKESLEEVMPDLATQDEDRKRYSF